MKRIAAIFLLLPLLLFASLAQAVPSVDEVQTAVKAGRYAQAETMMREVVASKPESAKAHYVLAEILAHNGQRDEALKETREARRIDPSIKFADPAKFARFEELLQQPRAAAGNGAGAYAGPNTGTVAAPSAEPRRNAPAVNRAGEERAAGGGGIPSWLWLVGAAVIAVVAWRFMASRRTSSAAAPMAAAGMAPSAGYPAAPVGGAPAGYGGGYAPQQYPPQQGGMAAGRGPGMMGVGLGVAGGVAAGMLAERMLHGGHDAPAHADAGSGAAAAGGLTPGAFDDGMGSADALRDRPIDFGGGGGWDDGGAADLGSDGGGGGGDDGGW